MFSHQSNGSKRSDSDRARNRMTYEIVHDRFSHGLKLRVTILNIPNQKANSLQFRFNWTQVIIGTLSGTLLRRQSRLSSAEPTGFRLGFGSLDAG